MILNPSKAFRESAKTTAPFVKRVPQNVREAFDIAEVNESGIFKIENISGEALYDRAYVFSDINYQKKDKQKKQSVLLNLMTFFSFMSVDHKITVASEYRNMYEFISEIFSDKNAESYPMISKGIRQFITQKIQEGNVQNIEKVMYLTITCRATSYQEARNYFKMMDTQLEDVFSKMESLILPLDGYQRLATVNKLIYLDESSEPVSFFDGKDTLLDVLPHSINADKNFMVFNEERYVSVLFARRFGSSLNEEEVIHTLTDVSYPSLLTLDFAPVEKEILDAKLINANTNNERNIAQEMDSKQTAGKIVQGISFQRSKEREELEGYISQVDSNSESCLLTGMLIVVTAPSEEILAQRVNEMVSNGKRVKVYLETINYVQQKAFCTALPFGCRRVTYMRAFLTSSIIGLQPFYAIDLAEPGGAFFGRNRTTNHLVFANRKKLKSPHGVIVGPTGTGKSFFIKNTEIAQTLLLTDDDIITIDPQNEMQLVCADFGGQFIDFTPKSNVHLNPMEISQYVLEHPNAQELFITEQSDWACSFCEAAMSGITFTQEHRSDIDKCVKKIYKDAFSQKHIKKQPSILYVREEIKNSLETAKYEEDRSRLLQIYNSLEQFTDGSYDMFAYDTNVVLDNRFISFGLKNIKKALWEPVMITIMHYLNMRMEYNQELQRATRFIVDEAQVVAEHEGSAQTLLNAIITFRKFGGICTLAFQNLVRVLENSDLRDMFQNCGMKVFFDQGGVEAERLAEVLQLSTTEYNSLAEKKDGYALMSWKGKTILLDTFMKKDNVLFDEFNTNFHDKKKTKQEEDVVEETAGEEFVPVLGTRDEDKEKIKTMAGIVAVSCEDVSNALNLTLQEARELLLELCREGVLIQESSAGVEFFKIKE